MLIVCNGLYKSGSTFVYMVCKEYYQADPPPRAFIGQTNRENTVLNEELLQSGYCEKKMLVAKTHLYELDLLSKLRNHASVILVFTNRCTKDIVRSHYHHFTNEKRRLPFIFYLPFVGFTKALETELFRHVILEQKAYDVLMEFDRFSAGFGPEWEKLLSCLGNKDIKRLETLVTELNRKGSRNLDGTGMTGREWFFRRKDQGSSAVESLLLGMLCNLAELAVRFKVARRFLYKMFTKYRYSAS